MAAEPHSLGHIRLIALDLDGTLLRSDKTLSPRSRDALAAAAARGVEIVPATGRFYRAMPAVVRELPFVRYAITINGAQVLDVRTGETIYSADIDTGEALAFYEYLDTLPVIYDAFVDGWGYMTEAMRSRAQDYGMLPFQMQMMRELRSGVPELKAWLRDGAHRPQKMQLYAGDTAYRNSLLKTLTERYPQFAVSYSLPNNIEINSRDADKGRALSVLAARLGLAMSQTAAFGDGLNDLSMLCAAGVGAAMSNGCPEVKAAADLIAADCDEDGVARVVEAMLADGARSV